MNHQLPQICCKNLYVILNMTDCINNNSKINNRNKGGKIPSFISIVYCFYKPINLTHLFF